MILLRTTQVLVFHVSSEKDQCLNDAEKADSKYSKKAWKVFKLHNLGQYYDLYLHNDTIFLSGIFKSFRTSALRFTN